MYEQLTFGQFQSANERRNDAAFDLEWGEAEYALALMGEAGKLAERVRKRAEFGTADEQDERAEVAELIGGVATYLSLLASSMGTNLSKAVFDEFNRVSDKKSYPRLPECV